MSSFLMNSGPYVDPKFPPPEEYSQNSYIPPQSDYYNPAQHYPYHGMHQAGMQYGREAMQYNHAGYYQQACVMPQHQPMAAHISPQLPPCHSPLQQHQVPPRSPVASPDPSATATGVGGGMGAQMAQHMGGGGVEGSPEETVTELDANGQPVIYPWMKKIHVAGSVNSWGHRCVSWSGKAGWQREERTQPDVNRSNGGLRVTEARPVRRSGD
ncbi:hypothetical protein Pmani_034273 [Petrolisthes manimaculis]|uniref:Uncharacterized protein n=1 Tax=Petrolisthes manimaculis TaxID=1843537 RepID=A0AAE1NMW6_9EUCA|nr:hypothetical protein Pmani_034273 [Petrolisthes manimaculis]